MKTKEMIMKLIKGEEPPISVWHYLVGNYRYMLYYSANWKWLIRPHIREQIDYRISVMNKECYNRGSCIHCGCMTTHLQMSSKQCKGKEYPVMMSKTKWKNYKIYGNAEQH